MTSRELIILVRRFPLLRKLDLRLEDDDILESGNQAQEHLLEELEPIEERGTLTFVPDQQVYTSAVTTWLPKVKRIVEPMKYLESGLLITESSESFVETLDGQGGFDYHYKSGQPHLYYVLRTVPISLAFFGIPTSALDVSVRFVRAHSDADNLKDATDGPHPLIPYRRALVLATVFFLLQDRIDEFPKQAGEIGTLFQVEKDRLLVARGRSPAERRFDPQEITDPGF